MTKSITTWEYHILTALKELLNQPQDRQSDDFRYLVHMKMTGACRKEIDGIIEEAERMMEKRGDLPI